MKKICLIKLGGSIITDSEFEDCINTKRITQIAHELQEAPSTNTLIIIHGTGHVGKPSAIEFGFEKTGTLPVEQRADALTVLHRIRKLHSRIVDCLHSAGLPVVGVPIPFRFNPLTQRWMDDSPLEIKAAVSQGIIPILYGDFIPDSSGEFHVVSSDVLMARVAETIDVYAALFLTDVDGILDSRKNLIRDIAPGRLKSADLNDDAKDVSGGMGEKVKWALKTADHVEICLIANGQKAGRIAELIRHIHEPNINARPACTTVFPKN